MDSEKSSEGTHHLPAKMTMAQWLMMFFLDLNKFFEAKIHMMEQKETFNELKKPTQLMNNFETLKATLR